MTEQVRPNGPFSRLWQPRAVAVVGAGSRPDSLGGRVLQYLAHHGYPGPVYPVNPKVPEFYPNLGALPGSVDLALLVVGAGHVMTALRECAARGVGYVVVHASGFGETGPEGRALEEEMAAFARRHGMRLIGPNCIGLVSPPDGLVAGFSPLFARVAFEPGNLGLVAQSGALGYGIASLAMERGLGFSRIINTGNEAELESLELVEHLLQDEATHAVLLYAEGLKRSAGWRSLGAASKPVIVLKAGRSEAGARAAASHTAALAGSDALWETAFRQLCIHRAADIDEALDLAAAFAQPRRPAGGRVGVLTTSGGAGILAADALSAHALSLPPLAGPTRAELEAIIPPFGSTANPVDVTAQVISDSQLFRRALRSMAADPALDLLLVCFCVLQGEEAERIALDLLAVHAETAKPILLSRTGAEFLAPGLAARLQRAGIPVYPTPARAARAAAALLQQSSRRPTPLPPWSPGPAAPPRVWTEPEAKALLAGAGLPVTREAVVTTADEAAAAAAWLGFPVVLKVVSSAIRHKTEVGGVRLHLQSPAAVHTAFAELAPLGDGRCLVQEQVTDAVAEVLVGVSPSPMGPLITVGLGGIFVEILQDVARRLAPVSEEEALAMLQELRSFPLLAGARGRGAGEIFALTRLTAGLSRWALERPGEWDLDLNPVLLTPSRCVIADALLVERGAAQVEGETARAERGEAHA